MIAPAEIRDRIAEKLTLTGAAPLPGGQGVYFAALRRRYPEMRLNPGVAERCFVCLMYLGDLDADEKWNGKAWLPHAAAWFDVHGSEFVTGLDAPRWRVLLDAMLLVALRRLAEAGGQQDLQTHLKACHQAACERLSRLHRRRGGASFLAQPLLAPGGAIVSPAEPEWAAAARELEGEHAHIVQTMYFMHVLHSNLGVAQPSLDQPYETRRRFYRALLSVLESANWCGACGAAAQVAAGLATTAVLNKPGSTTIRTAAIAARLPGCFRPAQHLGRSPSRATVARLVGRPGQARERLLGAHDLADAVADLLIDPLRSGGGPPAFRASDYSYLLSLVRDGPRRQAAASPSAAEDDRKTIALADPGAPQTWPMSKSFAERMASDQLTGPARTWIKRLTEAGCGVLPVARDCAICRRAQER